MTSQPSEIEASLQRAEQTLQYYHDELSPYGMDIDKCAVCSYAPEMTFDDLHIIIKSARQAEVLREALELVLCIVEQCHDCWSLSATKEQISFVEKALSDAEKMK